MQDRQAAVLRRRRGQGAAGDRDDAIGSIRVPAASSGIVSVKPGQGVLSSKIRYDSSYGTAENGPLATTVDDVRVALAVLSGRAVRHADPGVDQVRIDVLDGSPFPGTRVSDEARAGIEASPAP